MHLAAHLSWFDATVMRLSARSLSIQRGGSDILTFSSNIGRISSRPSKKLNGNDANSPNAKSSVIGRLMCRAPIQEHRSQRLEDNRFLLSNLSA